MAGWDLGGFLLFVAYLDFFVLFQIQVSFGWGVPSLLRYLPFLEISSSFEEVSMKKKPVILSISQVM
jgi:hypothetical protein